MSRFSYIITWLGINTSPSELQSCDGEPYRSYLHWYFAALSIRSNQPIFQRIFNSTTTCPRTRVPMFINNTVYHKYILGSSKSSVWTVDQSYLPSNSQQYKALQPQLQCIDQSQTCTLTTRVLLYNHAQSDKQILQARRTHIPIPEPRGPTLVQIIFHAHLHTPPTD